MLGKYWIDKQQNGDKNSFFLMLDGQQLNSDEKAIFSFMQMAQNRYENIKLPPEPRLNVSSLAEHFPKASENVLEALTKCCVLTYVFVPISDILEGEYKNSLSYAQRYAMWKGTGFKGVNAYGPAFIKESVSKKTPVVDNLFQLHQQMNIKGFAVEKVYSDTIQDVLDNSQTETLWTSKDEKAIAFREASFKVYPDLKYQLYEEPKKISRFPNAINLRRCRQKTL